MENIEKRPGTPPDYQHQHQHPGFLASFVQTRTAGKGKQSRAVRDLARMLDDALELLLRQRLIVAVFVVLACLSLFTSIPLLPHYTFSKGNVVIILAANEGGGVMQWKGARDWSVERSSISNKKAYAARHGYHLAIKDVSPKKRYAHEWRESWEKADILKQTMRQFPDAEWFWWMDLHTYIMEPELSLEKHVFAKLAAPNGEQDGLFYRDVSYYNPLNITLAIPYTDYKQPVDMWISQDCGGFNLGSFLMRRSEWTEKLLDVWWDPVFYEQKHMEWEHKEQDALEYLYTHEAWIRGRVGFLPLRTMNSFPPGACEGQYENGNDPRFFYDERDRDFVINMAGCQWGRDCWGEMERYKALSQNLHSRRWWPFGGHGGQSR